MLFFFRANDPESYIIKEILTIFATAFRQIINFGKSSITFSGNVKADVQMSIGNFLGVCRGESGSKYLGLPSLIGRNKKDILGFIKEKITSKIYSWNSRYLSNAGREIMLKNVIQAIPNYAMSVFLLPKEMCNEIEHIMNAYWWGCELVGKGIRWKSWTHLCTPKKLGGLGFKSLRNFNLAMLGKQAWRFIQFPDSLLARVFKARYYPNSSFFEAPIGSNLLKYGQTLGYQMTAMLIFKVLCLLNWNTSQCTLL